jgi:hypothetical protein
LGYAPEAQLGVYNALRATGGVDVGVFQAGEGPLGDRVGQSAREVEGGEGVEAFDAAPGVTNTGDLGAVAGEVPRVNLVHRFCANLFLSCADAACGFDAGDGRPKGGAGDPEACRHLKAALILYDAREASRAASGYAEGDRLASKLERHGLMVIQ